MMKGKEWKAEELASRFSEYVALEQETMESAEARGYWEQQLRDVGAMRMPWGGRGSVEVEIGEEITAGLRKLAQELEVSLKTVLLAGHLRVMGLLGGGEED